MILGLISLASALFCSIVFVTLVITGGPVVWIGTLLMMMWVGSRVSRWLQKTSVPVDVEVILPADHR